MEDLMKLDLYDLIGVSHDAGSKDIKTAYRKSALKCHPDKNPDNPAAARLFHQLSRALEILTDGPAKDAYDKILKARKAAEIRNRQLDSKRKKLKDDLEQRERAAEEQSQREVPADAAQKFRAEVERLRKEGSRQLQEEVEIMKEQLKAEMERLGATVEDAGSRGGGVSPPRVKIQWKRGPVVRYTHESLVQRFKKYGEVTALVMSSKNRALLEFASLESAEEALKNETGFEDNPLRLTWINRPMFAESAEPEEVVEVRKIAGVKLTGSERDYENIVLMKLRQAQERKRLNDQMRKEDLEET